MKSISLGRALAAVALCASFAAFADEPPGYYAPLNGKKDAELKTAIFNLVRNFTTVSSYNDLPTYFRRTDVHIISGVSYWWDMYGDVPIESRSWNGSLLNREHSFPKSWWGGSTGTTAYVDLNHLYPADAAANMAKSNYPLGEVSINDKPKYNNGVSVIGYPVNGQGGGAAFVFEPDDEYKGDFARTYFYMVTCYQNLIWASKYTYMLQQNTYPTLKPWAYELLLKWHHDDPVSEKEIQRNDVVYTIQNNRNPFIDRPELADYIWGDKQGQVYTASSTSTGGKPTLITPVQDMALDFGQCAVGQSITRDLPFRGDNLTGSLELIVYRGNPASATSMFATSSSALSAQLVNSTNGTVLKVTYTPTEVGVHTARLLINQGGLSGSLGVEFRGEGMEVPTLTACKATEATDITSDSYRANWEYPTNEIIDYWVINRTMYTGGSVKTEEVLAEEPGTIIEGFNDSDKESYTVQSVRLGYKSPESNVIFVDHSGITGVWADQPLIVQGFDGFMRFICSSEQTNARVYDMTGRLAATIDVVYQNLDVDMATGVYMVVTDQCRRPVKVVVK